MAQKYLSKKGGRFYCLYIDFRKAFDKINHSVMFQALQRKGVKGKLLNVLKNMYSSLYSCVKVHNTAVTNSAVKYRNNCQITISEFFQCNIGTHQGGQDQLYHICSIYR